MGARKSGAAPEDDGKPVAASARKPAATASSSMSSSQRSPSKRESSRTGRAAASSSSSSSSQPLGKARKSGAASSSQETFSQPKLSFSSKPRADHDSYFLSPSPPRASTSTQRSREGTARAKRPVPSRLRTTRTSARSSAASAEDPIVISSSGSSDGELDVLRTRALKTSSSTVTSLLEAETSTCSELWVDHFPPESTSALAVHRKKVDQVRDWLAEALDGSPAVRIYRRLLVLTGPSGAGKSATVHALASAQELDFSLVEWENAWGNNIGGTLAPAEGSSSRAENFQSRFMPTSQSATQLFADFLASSSRFGTLSMQDEDDDESRNATDDRRIGTSSQSACASGAIPAPTPPTSSQQLMPPPPAPSNSAQQASSRPSDTKSTARRIILLDDLPNLSHAPTRLAFQSTLATYLAHTQAQAKEHAAAIRGRQGSSTLASHAAPAQFPPPIVLLLSDSTGRESDASIASDAMAGRGSSGTWRREEELSLRTVLGEELRRDPRVTEIKFNPVAPTILKKALVRILDLAYASNYVSPLPEAAPMKSSSSRSRSNANAVKKAKRDKAFETELIRLLCSATDDSNVAADGQSAAFSGKRKAIERPTGGDLRSAITQMQFLLEHEQRVAASRSEAPQSSLAVAGLKRDRSGAVLDTDTTRGKSVKGKEKQSEAPSNSIQRARKLIAVVSRRESNLPLFHAVGRVLYNKRVGDPGGSDDESNAKTQSAKQRTSLSDNEQDDHKITMSDQGASEKRETGQKKGREVLWTALPDHLHDLERRPSKINVEAIWAQAPVDSSLMQLYLHHNFPSFCAEIEECSSGLDFISFADSELRMRTESWTHASLSAYYSFLVSTSGILLSLPSPIPPYRPSTDRDDGQSGANSAFAFGSRSARHRQIRKSAFFDAYRRMQGVGESLEDAGAWLLHSSALDASRSSGTPRSRSEHGKGLGRTLHDAPDAIAERSCLSTVSRTAMAVEVVPLLAKLGQAAGQQPNAKPQAKSLGGNSNRAHTLVQGGGKALFSKVAESASAAQLFPSTIAEVGLFDHLTAAQAAQALDALRTEALDESGLLGGADEPETETIARAGGEDDAETTWTEQVADDGEGDDVRREAEGDTRAFGRGRTGETGRRGNMEWDVGLDEVHGESGLMDSEDEIASDSDF